MIDLNLLALDLEREVHAYSAGERTEQAFALVVPQAAHNLSHALAIEHLKDKF